MDIEMKKPENFENQELFEDENQTHLFEKPKQTDSIQTELKEHQDDFTFGDLSDGQETKVRFDEDEKIEIKTIEDKDGNKEEIKYLITPLIIKSVKILKPRVKDINGDIIAPLVTKTGNKKYYTSKLEILYENSQYKSLVPTIRWWVNGVNNANPSFEIEYKEPIDLKFKTDITKLYWKFCDMFGYDKTQKDKKKILTQKMFIDELLGKKVKVKEIKSFYEGEWRYKITIDSFIKE